MIGIEVYASATVSWDRIDIRTSPSLSIDLRAETGAGMVPDETQTMPAGSFSLSVCGQYAGDLPIGEIRLWYPPANKEIRIVGALTGRPGVMEITPDILMSLDDEAYRQSILQWLGVATS